MGFVPLYYGDRMHVVNPNGDIGVITLWTDVRKARQRLEEMLPGVLDVSRSRVAVMANLYGDGMYAMFCNLLYNPQIRHLIAVGQDRGLPTCDEMEAFLANGLEPHDMYGSRLQRIRGTSRFLPDVEEFDEHVLRDRLTFSNLGKLSDPDLPRRLNVMLRDLPAVADAGAQRLRVDIPIGTSDEDGRRPSQLNGHQVTRDGPLATWKELVVRSIRFGRPVRVAGGQRLELLNVKAVINHPREEDADVLHRFGFNVDSLRRYQAKMLQDEPPEPDSYTYGNRLHAYFPQPGGGRDAIDTAIDALRRNIDTRHAYVSLWDPASDPNRASAPCLTTMFFRAAPTGLTLTATYRAHNLLTAWLENVFGLMAIQRHVCERIGMAPSAITVISHSLGINPETPFFQRAVAMARHWSRDDDYDEVTGKYALREDPNGHFIVTADSEAGAIVAEHWANGVMLKRYEGRRADVISRQIAADLAVSLPSHALWVGQELVRKEQDLHKSALDHGRH